MKRENAVIASIVAVVPVVAFIAVMQRSEPAFRVMNYRVTSLATMTRAQASSLNCEKIRQDVSRTWARGRSKEF